MRKTIMGRDEAVVHEPGWLDLQQSARVELSSEQSEWPIESALVPGGAGWRASRPGEQTIRFLFDRPQDLTHIHLMFEETERERTQAFVLRWSADDGRSYHEVVRQQYNFSPPGTTREIEDYRVALKGVTVLELRITPDVSADAGRASLARLRVA